MNGLRSWIAGVVAAMLGVMMVSVLVGPRLLHLAPRSVPPQVTGNLPPGVCSLSAEKLDLPNSTRVEAKLVTYRSANRSDPNFPWRQYPPPPRPASWSRLSLPPPTPPPPYYWMVALHGVYVWNVNHLPRISSSTPPGPATFHDVLSYVSADTCEGRGVSAGSGGWPVWFDKMPAVVDIKFK